MKIKNIVFFCVFVLSINSLNAVKLIVKKLDMKNSDKSVSIFWKDGASGFVLLKDGNQIILSSPWNKDIIGVRWSELVNNMPVFYEYPLHISAFKAPWQKDALLLIGNNGEIRFDLGKGMQKGKAMSKKERKELKEEGWGVVD